MAIQRHFETITVTASQDLSGHQYKAVGLHGGVGITAALAAGILQTKALVGDHATLAYRGHVKVLTGAVVNSNAPITVNASGFIVAYTPAGSGGLGAVGRMLTQAASGDVSDAIVDFMASPA